MEVTGTVQRKVVGTRVSDAATGRVVLHASLLRGSV